MGGLVLTEMELSRRIDADWVLNELAIAFWAEVESHLVAENRARAGSGTVALIRALGQDAVEKVEILAHRLPLAGRGEPEKANRTW